MRQLFLLLTLLTFMFEVKGQTGSWQLLDVPKGDINLFTMRSATIHNSNYYIAGTFTSNLEYGNTTITNNAGDGIFVSKCDNYGQPKWVYKIGSSTGFSNNHTIALALDSSENLYISCYFKDSINIGNDLIFSNGDYDLIVVKINKYGIILWTKHIGSSTLDGVSMNTKSMLIDKNQHVRVCGVLSSPIVIDSLSFTSTYGDAVVIELDTNGQVLDYKQTGSLQGWDNGTAIVFDPTYSLITLNSNLRTSNILIDTIVLNINNEYESTAIATVSKYNTNGQIQWVRHFGGGTYGASFNANTVKTDSKGNVYLSGSCRIDNFAVDQYKIQGGGLFGGSGKDVFILKYDKDGNFKWFQKTRYTDEEDWRGFDISDNDELYLTYGYNTKSMIGSDSIVSAGGKDIAIVKLDTLGNVLWMNSIGGTGFDENVSLLCADTTIYLLGQSKSTPCHFNQTDHTTQAPGNLFLARLNKYELWPVGVQDQALEAMSIYPNPSQGHSTLTLPHATQGYYSLHDMAGRVLLKQNLHPSQTTYHINTAALNSGVYLLRVQTTQGSKSVKLVVE